MKLNPFDGILAMAQTHHDSVTSLGAHLEAGWDIRDNQRVISRRGKALRQIPEYRFFVVEYGTRLSMHQRQRTYHEAAKDFPDSLMAKTNAKNRNRFVKRFNYLFGDSSIP